MKTKKQCSENTENRREYRENVLRKRAKGKYGKPRGDKRQRGQAKDMADSGEKERRNVRNNTNRPGKKHSQQ